MSALCYRYDIIRGLTEHCGFESHNSDNAKLCCVAHRYLSHFAGCVTELEESEPKAAASPSFYSRFDLVSFLHKCVSILLDFSNLKLVRLSSLRNVSMCIALLSTAHPAYSLILIDNRDEYLNRPTAPAEWWSYDGIEILSGRDLLRPEQGTWLGVTKAGKVAVLTNFREDVTPPPSAISRGAIIKDFLREAGPSRAWVKQMVASGKGRDVGGFSLVCGQLAASSGKPEDEGLAVFSNRVKVEGDVEWIFGQDAGSQAVGLSNGPFKGMPTKGAAEEDTESWKKVTDGERLMDAALKESQEAGEAEEQLIRRLLGVLSTDTLPRDESEAEGGLETYMNRLRNTIFVPAVGRKDPPDEIAAARKEQKAAIFTEATALGVSGLYGTQKQTVILVNHAGKVRFFERTLYDNDVHKLTVPDGDRDFKFEIAH